MLQVVEVCKGWEGEEVLKGVSLELRKGEIIAIIGASGSGKTTLLNIIGGLMKPSKGRVLFFDQDIHSQKERELNIFRNKKIGFIFQTYNLLSGLSLMENILLSANIAGLSSKDRAKNLISLLGLSGRERRLPGMLSSGEQQRAAIARALINEPEIILADEPTGSLDLETADKVFSLLKERVEEEERSMVIVTHNRRLAEQTDRLFLLEGGRLF
ncbi:ABC transporter ATP-binding protein [bacterium]|nr:ABC transporter ATP-binding protein [bacterium]MBU1598761.1 ABC transporter ATP-binding protein [bacterium]